jgi:hypothetical protein
LMQTPTNSGADRDTRQNPLHSPLLRIRHPAVSPGGPDKMDHKCNKLHLLRFLQRSEMGIPASRCYRCEERMNVPQLSEALELPQLSR